MKIKNLFLATAAAVAVAFSGTAQAVTFDISSGAADLIVFDNGQFTFQPLTPTNFEVDTGSAINKLGLITGTFTIGAPIDAFTAPVTGNGTFTILDGATPLTAALTWVEIFQRGSTGDLNTFLSVNLTGITYAGGNADLVALASAGSGAINLSYNLSSNVTLQQLIDGAERSGTFSGTVVSTVPDGGSTVALMGLALLGVAAVRSKLQLA